MTPDRKKSSLRKFAKRHPEVFGMFSFAFKHPMFPSTFIRSLACRLFGGQDLTRGQVLAAYRVYHRDYRKEWK